MSETQTKTCSKCKETKPADLFNHDRSMKDGLKGWCRSCQTEQALLSRGHPSGTGYWLERETGWRRQGIRNADGTPFLRADYHRLSELQGGVCALCGRHPPMWSVTLSVDHDRKTGKARGLLCTDCNHYALGMFEKYGRFGRRQDVNNLIRSYLENPPASRLSRAEETDGLEPQPIITSVIISPPRSTISWTPVFSHQVIISEETP